MPTLTIAIMLGMSLKANEPAKTIPTDARSIIRKVHLAARKRDYPTLRSLMVSEFTWSFGGDGNADQAINAWRRDPAAMLELTRITGQRCAFSNDQENIQCPPNAGYRYRAEFKKTDSGWRMSYFVAGD